MAKPSRDVPPALEGNDQLVAAAGTVVWAIALIVLVIMRNHTPPSSHWWIWTCVVGVGLGIFALTYVPRMKRSRARAAAKHSADEASS